MNIQEVLAEAQARADANDDGKLDMHDIEELANDHGIDKNVVDSLKERADANGDGKIDPSDIGGALSNVGKMTGDLKDQLFGNHR
jgi:hypothetical protein